VIEAFVNTESLERSVRGSITGEISLRSDTDHFPDPRWSDFPVVLLAWWIDGLHEVAIGRENSFVGHFMDGPYAFIVKRGAGNATTIAWGTRDEEEPIGDVDVRALQLSVIAAGQRVVAVCHAKGWPGKDLESLEQALARSAA
jgi:hypothetical protein